jgi:hypothetical protein
MQGVPAKKHMQRRTGAMIQKLVLFQVNQALCMRAVCAANNATKVGARQCRILLCTRAAPF